MEQESGFNPEKEFESIKKDFSRIFQPLMDIKSIKVKDPDYDDRLKKILNRLPKGDDLKKPYDEIVQRLKDFINKSEKYSKDSFARSKTEYLQNLNKKGTPYRTIDTNFFRVGILEIETKAETAQIRILFNRAVVLTWKVMKSAEEIEQYVTLALNTINQCKIDEKQLPIIIKNAYERIKNKQEQSKRMNAHLVLIKSLHKEIIKELFYQQIRNKTSFNTKIKEIYFPDWAFLYNLDLYRSLLSSVAAEYQLVFETGSQTQTERDGVILNGLSPTSEFKKFCFLKGRNLN